MGWALGSKSLNPPSHSVHFHSSISYCSRKLTTSYQEIRLYRTSWTPWLHTPIVHWMRGRWVYLYIVFRNAFWKCQNWIWNEIRFFIEHIRKCQSDLTLILLWIGLISNKNGWNTELFATIRYFLIIMILSVQQNYGVVIG